VRFGDLMSWIENTNDRKIEWTNSRSTVFRAFIFIIMHILCPNGSGTRWLYYKPIEDIIKNIIVYFGDFMSWNEASNERKLEEIEILFLYIFMLIFECYPYYKY
jgi:uncharacterized protein involved in cysteine biosynthesis